MDKKKKLSRMSAWTIAVFATIFAIVFVIMWMPFYYAGNSALTAIGKAFAAGWSIYVIDLVLCIGVYFGYKLYLDRKT